MRATKRTINNRTWRLMLVVMLIFSLLPSLPAQAQSHVITSVFQISASSDDAVETNDTDINTSSGYLSLGRGGGVDVTDIGLRWENDEVPPRATIESAHISLTGYGYGLEAGVMTRIKGIKQSNAMPFSSSNRPSTQPKTTAATDWNLSSWSASTPYDSPDLKALVQELVDQPGWTQDSPFAIAWEDNGTGAWRARYVFSYDDWQGPVNAPKLTVAFTDTFGPAASNVTTSSPINDQGTIGWQTDEKATSQIEYGLTTNYGQQTTLDPALVRDHEQVLTGLTPNVPIHFRILSTDQSGNQSTSPDFTIMVSDNPVPPPPVESTSVFQISASSDDAVETNDTDINTSSGYLSLGRGGGVDVTDIGLRWENDEVPPRATIESAHISLTGYGYGLEAGVMTRIKGIKQSNAMPFSSSNRPSTQPKTTAATDWNLSSWSASTPYDSPDLKALVQELVDQPGWTQDSPFAIAWEDNGTGAWRARYVFSYDDWQGPANAPKLTVTYSDTYAPEISGVTTSSATSNEGTVNWQTDERATSQIEYGLTTNYGQQTTLDTALARNHEQVLSGLTTDTPYHFRVLSTDQSGNQSASSDYTIMVTDNPAPPAPVEATSVFQISASSDDAVETNDTDINTSSGYLSLGRGGGVDVTDIGLRWENDEVPPRATIESAHISLTGYGYGLEAGVMTRIKGIKQSNAMPFSSSNRPSTQLKTTAATDWNLSSWSANTPYDSPDLKALIQELVDQPGWTQDSPFAIAWEDNGTLAWRSRNVYSHDNWQGSANAPKLTVTFTDTYGPNASNVTTSSITNKLAKIKWRTDEKATSQIEYGLTTNYGQQTTLDTALARDHEQVLSGLIPDTPYHFRVLGMDQSGNQSASSDYTFSTSDSPSALVSFTFDDGLKNTFTNAFPVLEGFNAPGTVYVPTDSIGASSAAMSLEDLKQLQAEGWEISSHSKDHLISAGTPADAYESNIQIAKEALESYGFPDPGYATPGGHWSHDVVTMARKYYGYVRIADGASNKLPFDRNKLSAKVLDGYTSLDSVKSSLDTAQSNNEWIVFLIHGVSDWPSNTKPAFLQEILEELANRDIPVFNVRDVIRSEFPDTTIDLWKDVNQAPILPTFSDYSQINSGSWNEYWPQFSGYPRIMGHSGNDSLPTLRFSSSVPNGTYDVYANLAGSSQSTYRYFYGLDTSSPVDSSVDVANQTGFREHYLGTVTITDGQFELYVQKADAVQGSDGYFAWTWVKLVDRI